MKVTYTNECGDIETIECTCLALAGPCEEENWGKFTYTLIDGNASWATTGHFEVSHD